MPAADGSLSATSHATISGDTGRFANASGTFEQVNLAPDRFSSGTIEGTLNRGN